MKRHFFILLFISLLLIGILFLSSCFNSKADDKISITFFVDGQQFDIKKAYQINSITLPKSPTKEGYEFEGWYLDDGVWNVPITEETLFAQNIRENSNAYAKFSIITYQIHYNTGGATHNNTDTYTVEDEFELQDAQKTGYNFVGWYKDSSYKEQVTSIHSGTSGNLVLYAKFEGISNYIIYESNGGEHSNPTSYKTTESIELSDAHKEHYNFLGWFMDNNYTNQIDSIYRGTQGEVTLYAKFEPASYIIKYEDEKESENINPTAYTIESEFKLEPLYEKGYVFLGWFIGDKKIRQINKGMFGELTLVAKWAEENIILTKNIDDAGIVSGFESGLAVDDEVTLSAFTNPGYTWLGWFDGEKKVSLGNNTYFTFVNTGEQKIYTAKWAEYFLNIDILDGGELYKGYEISFDLNGGTGTVPQTQYVNTLTKLIYPTAPIRDSYLFTGWYIDATCENIFDWSANVTSNIKLYAGWYYVGNRGYATSIESLYKGIDSSVNIDQSYNRSWSYVYFSILYECDFEVDFKYAVSNLYGYGLDFELYNVTQEKTYDYYLKQIGDSWYAKFAINKSNVNIGDVIYLKVRYDQDSPTKELGKVAYQISAKNSISLGAGNIACSEGRYSAGTEITLSVSTNPGYSWIGWFVGEEKVSEEQTYTLTMPNNSITLTPKWEIIPD